MSNDFKRLIPKRTQKMFSVKTRNVETNNHDIHSPQKTNSDNSYRNLVLAIATVGSLLFGVSIWTYELGKENAMDNYPDKYHSALISIKNLEDNIIGLKGENKSLQAELDMINPKLNELKTQVESPKELSLNNISSDNSESPSTFLPESYEIQERDTKKYFEEELYVSVTQIMRAVNEQDLVNLKISMSNSEVETFTKLGVGDKVTYY